MAKRTVAGVDVSKVDEDVLNKALAAKNLAGGGSVAKRIERMTSWVADNSRPQDLLECDNCGGASDVSFEICPFCGDSAAEEDVQEAIVEHEVTVDAVVIDGEAVDEAVLDKIVQRVSGLTKNMATNYAKNYHQIGVELRRIRDLDLWRLRTKKEGAAVKYKGFVDFLRSEVGMSHTQAQKIIKVSEVFTEAEVVEHGHSRLAQVMKLPLPPEMARKLLSEGTSTRAMAGLLPAPEPPAPRAAPPADQVTVALMKGQTHVDLFARTGVGGRESEPRRAVSVDDDAWGELHLTNGVVLAFRLAQNRAGELILVVDVKRESLAATG